MRQTTDYSQWFVEATHKTARDAFKALVNTGCAPHYLYYKPNGLELLVLIEGAECPTGFILASDSQIPGNLTVDQLTRWIREHTQSLPLLPAD